jgi:hypothetical protein
MAVWSVKEKARRLGGGSKEEEGGIQKRIEQVEWRGEWSERIEEERRKTERRDNFTVG